MGDAMKMNKTLLASAVLGLGAMSTANAGGIGSLVAQPIGAVRPILSAPAAAAMPKLAATGHALAAAAGTKGLGGIPSLHASATALPGLAASPAYVGPVWLHDNVLATQQVIRQAKDAFVSARYVAFNYPPLFAACLGGGECYYGGNPVNAAPAFLSDLGNGMAGAIIKVGPVPLPHMPNGFLQAQVNAAVNQVNATLFPQHNQL
jgi:hypothetical protein